MLGATLDDSPPSPSTAPVRRCRRFQARAGELEHRLPEILSRWPRQQRSLPGFWHDGTTSSLITQDGVEHGRAATTTGNSTAAVRAAGCPARAKRRKYIKLPTDAAIPALQQVALQKRRRYDQPIGEGFMFLPFLSMSRRRGRSPRLAISLMLALGLIRLSVQGPPLQPPGRTPADSGQPKECPGCGRAVRPDRRGRYRCLVCGKKFAAAQAKDYR
jgi:hypothetical protein